MEPKGYSTTCQQVQERFLELLDGDLEGAIRERLEAHLMGCQGCAKHWESYVATVRALGSLEQLAVPERVLERIRARIHRRSAVPRLAAWARMAPWRVPVPALAALVIFSVAAGLWQWGPWVPKEPTGSGSASLSQPELTARVQPLEVGGGPFFNNEGLLSPVRALDPDLDWPLKGRIMVQDEMVLDLTGSEEIFQRIEAILRESRGKMFLMGVRHRGSGQVIRSRILLEVPLESYEQVVQQIESLAPVHRVFLERDALPPRPDRLRISVVGTDAFENREAFPLQNVRAD